MVKSNRKIKPYFKLIISIILSIYIVAFIYSFFDNKLIIDAFDHGEIVNKYSSKAILIQDVYVIKNSSEGEIKYLYKDGERVKKSADMILMYPKEVKDLYEQYYLLSDKIQLSKKEYIQNETIENNEAAKLKSGRDELFLKLYYDITLNKLEVLNKEISEINSTIVDVIYKRVVPNQDIENLIDQQEKIYERLKEKNLVIRAPESGIFSSKTDGYEVSSSRDLLSVLTSSMVNDTILDPIGKKYNKNQLGKLIISNDYFIAVIIPEDIKKLILDQEYVRIYFPQIPEPYYALKHQLIERDQAETILILRTDRYLETLINKRVIDLDLILSSDSGIKIPISAMLDIDDKDKTAHIFISRNGNILKQKVNIKTQDKLYAVISSEELKTYDLLVKNPKKAKEGAFIK